MAVLHGVESNADMRETRASGTLNINETSNIGNVSYTDADGEIVVCHIIGEE